MKRKNIADLILNLLIVLCTVWAVGGYFFGGPDILGSTGTGCLKYFTTDSNILVGIAALILLPYNIRRLRTPDAAIPRWAMSLKFVGTVSVTVTFLTVVFFLAPVACLNGGIGRFLFFFAGNTFALHFSTPVLAVISVLFCEHEPPLTRRDTFLALLPTAVYAVVYCVMVVFVKLWTDWYGFTFGGKLYLAPFSIIGMLLATWGIAAAEKRLNRRIAANAGKEKAKIPQ